MIWFALKYCGSGLNLMENLDFVTKKINSYFLDELCHFHFGLLVYLPTNWLFCLAFVKLAKRLRILILREKKVNFFIVGILVTNVVTFIQLAVSSFYCKTCNSMFEHHLTLLWKFLFIRNPVASERYIIICSF